MQFDVITLFPEMFSALTSFGVTGRAFEKKVCEINLWNPRDFVNNKHRSVDDRPYGGGPGMVMLSEPIEMAIKAAKDRHKKLGLLKTMSIFLSPHGLKLEQNKIKSLLSEKGLVLLCGRYEGVDQRLLDLYIDQEISVGDFVVSGGELPAMTLMDALIRQIPGSLNDAKSKDEESFENGLLDFPQYTRPLVYKGLDVPEELLSGNHRKIKIWRRKRSLEYTQKKRPEMIRYARLKGLLSENDELFLKKLYLTKKNN
tara:strand:+ start:225 stop:992 length:768 start_codon:yes stop_codon:yes gene_type:complete